MDSIDLRFISIHVPGRDNANQVATNREGDEEKSPRSRLPYRVVTFFGFSMPHIATNDEGGLEEDLFGFLRRYRMPFPVLLCMRLVPIKSSAPIQRVSA
jgi:hypothetical protein